MTIQLQPVTKDPDLDLAESLVNVLKACYQITEVAQTGNTNDNYNALVNIPTYNKQLQDKIAEIQATGRVSTILGFVDSHKLLPSGFTITDAQNFASALDSLATDIEANASLFILSLDPISKGTQFITPVAQGIKDTIATRLTAVLAETN